MDVVGCEGECREGGKVLKNGVKAISKLVVEGEFRMIDAIEEMVAVRVDVCSAYIKVCLGV